MKLLVSARLPRRVGLVGVARGRRSDDGLTGTRFVTPVLLFLLAAAVAVILCLAVAQSPADARRGSPAGSSVKTLFRLPELIAAFAADGDRVAWVVQETDPPSAAVCRGLVRERDLRSSRTYSLSAAVGPTCWDYRNSYGGTADGFQDPMALSRVGALWAFSSSGNSHYEFSVDRGRIGERDRLDGSVTISGGLGDPGGLFRPVPMAGAGQTLVWIDIDQTGSRPLGVRVAGRLRPVPGTTGAYVVAAFGDSFAFARPAGAGQSEVEVRETATGALERRVRLAGQVQALALGNLSIAALVSPRGEAYQVLLVLPRGRGRRRSVIVSSSAAQLSISAGRVVYLDQSRRTIHLFDLRTGRDVPVATRPRSGTVLGLSIDRNRIIWAEEVAADNTADTAVRNLLLPPSTP